MGKQYTFTSSVATDFITIANETGKEVIKYGTGPITISVITNQIVKFQLNLANNCTYSTETRPKLVSYNDITRCQWTVHVFDFLGMGDEVSWSLKDNVGNIVLSGTGYDATQTPIADGSFTFYIESMDSFGDNSPSYTISNRTSELVSESLPQDLGVQEATYSRLNCATLAVDNNDKNKVVHYPNPVTDILNKNLQERILVQYL